MRFPTNFSYRCPADGSEIAIDGGCLGQTHDADTCPAFHGTLAERPGSILNEYRSTGPTRSMPVPKCMERSPFDQCRSCQSHSSCRKEPTLGIGGIGLEIRTARDVDNSGESRTMISARSP